MLPNGAAREAATPLLDLLRSATRAAHTSLEDALGLLEPPLSRRRFVHALQAFHAFHVMWEPQVMALAADPRLLEPRSKLSALERDLGALGLPVATSPRKGGFDLDYLSTPAAAWGSLYVIEGSTLGGQVISKALRTAAWAPDGGLTYFNPYGRRTAAMWAEFREALEAHECALDVDGVVEGARATFRVLQGGLAAAGERAA